MRKQRHILRECLRRALEKPRPPGPRRRKFHYTFIIQSGKILAMGQNREGRALLEQGYDEHQVIHAENDAWMKARGILDPKKDFQAVNLRLTRNDEMRLSAPCPCCKRFLDSLGCSEIFFTTNEGWAKAC